MEHESQHLPIPNLGIYTKLIEHLGYIVSKYPSTSINALVDRHVGVEENYIYIYSGGSPVPRKLLNMALDMILRNIYTKFRYIYQTDWASGIHVYKPYTACGCWGEFLQPIRSLHLVGGRPLPRPTLWPGRVPGRFFRSTVDVDGDMALTQYGFMMVWCIYIYIIIIIYIYVFVWIYNGFILVLNWSC